MEYYIAIDHNSTQFEKPWTFIRIKGYGNSKPTVREVRNWFLTHQKTFPYIYCALIMKKMKKNLYKGIEQVFPSGTSYEKKDEWPLNDSVFEDKYTFYC